LETPEKQGNYAVFGMMKPEHRQIKTDCRKGAKMKKQNVHILG